MLGLRRWRKLSQKKKDGMSRLIDGMVGLKLVSGKKLRACYRWGRAVGKQWEGAPLWLIYEMLRTGGIITRMPSERSGNKGGDSYC